MSAAQSLASVSISPSSVVGGDSTTGTIKLTANAPANGFDVQVSCAHSYVQVPATVTVPAGSNIKTFSISTSLVTSKSSATVTFSAGSQSLHATLTVSPSLVPLQRISVTPASVIGTYSSKGKITLTEQAQGAGETVFLASDQSCAQVPASIVVPGGGTSATITVTTHRVSAPTTATLTASVKGVAGTVSCALDVEAWPVQSVSLTPNPVVGGFAVSGVVTLGLRAPQGGIDVQLSSQMGYATPTVGTITIKAGYLTGSFKVRTAVTPNQRFDTVSATTGGPPATAPITIDPPTVTSLTLSPSTVSGGSTSTGTLTVSLPAPAGGEVIHLASDSTIATVPSAVVVAAGYKTAKFIVQTGVLGANCFADITGSVADSSAKAPINVMGNGLGASAWPQLYQNNQNTTLGVASGANGVHKWGMFRDDGVFTVP
ncbi:MAG TPA: hypothetical protein VG944_00260, partial [Fimbriimonas sp.]|nr:hypothetical protein [Fimbriimonas sp.]